jgi:pimeloyl-ACP methyl ester carboxylesterase
MKRRQLLKMAAAGAAVFPFTGFAQSTEFTFYSSLAKNWHDEGRYFSWTSTTEFNNNQEVQVFYRTFGNPSDPPLLLVHGYPTSSIDFSELIPYLQDDYFIAALDFPGFGFSDKPQNGYSYMLEDDARLLDHFVANILGWQRFHMFTHDRGVSVGLAFLGNYLDNPDPGYELMYHFMSNSGMYLPLSTLGENRAPLLHPVQGLEQIAELKARPRLTSGPERWVINADIHAFNDGIGARLYVGKYLLERAANEHRWLENLTRSPVPVAYLWGLRDAGQPARVANHVWQTYLNDRDVESSLWYLPTAGHYPQLDKPAEVAEVVKRCLQGGVPSRAEENAFMRSHARGTSVDSPILVGHTVPRQMEFPGAVEYSPSGYRY